MNARHLWRTLIAGSLIASTTLAQASAGHRHETTVRARVLAAEPAYLMVSEPQTQCWTETVGHRHRQHSDGNGGAVIGAIAGGLLGSTVGKGNGRVAAAAIGAATGAVIGDRLDDHGAYGYGPREIERCRTTESSRRVLDGYDVRYRYQGQDYTTRLPYDPGRWLTLRVSVRVDDDEDRRHRHDD